MNKVILSGNAVRDAEIRYTTGDNAMAIARDSIAVSRRRKADNSGQTADFINIVAFGKTAEFCEKYMKKGVKFNICGHIQTGSYTNKDGNKVYTTDVIVDEIEFAASASNSAAPAQDAPLPEQAPDEFINIPDGIADELPFN